MIELKSVTTCFGNVVAMKNVSFRVDEGELLALVGGSGSGKSTTLRTINRLAWPTEGSVEINANNIYEDPAFEIRRRVGFCFQRAGLFPHMTVAENIGITPKLLGWNAETVSERVHQLMNLVELEPSEYASRMPRQLSGGQQQRVGVARALAARPAVVLFDEPFGAVDPITRGRLQQFLRRVRKETGLTGVFVTHDVVEAMLVADRIGIMHEGELLQVGTAHELLRSPKNEYVEDLLAEPARQADEVEKILGIRPTEGDR